ncbi:hypothetical protein HAX54_024839 [Datura stramonium]|uniref:Uncharacterized protein n=1 Tax=Datura stramonium TaxID=4076 RepID=A0ABS8UYE6_DATST|nr:hypothetical protein [Datura stramonium]
MLGQHGKRFNHGAHLEGGLEIINKFAKTDVAWYRPAQTNCKPPQGEHHSYKAQMERDQDMTRIKAQMELITMHLTSMNTYKRSDICDVAPMQPRITAAMCRAPYGTSKVNPASTRKGATNSKSNP